jgi:hypothetical protein
MVENVSVWGRGGDQVGYDTFIIDSRRPIYRNDLRLLLPDNMLDGMLRSGPAA